jgi:hypothetical protein
MCCFQAGFALRARSRDFKWGGGGWTPPGVEGGVKRISHCKSSFFQPVLQTKKVCERRGEWEGAADTKSFPFNIKGNIRPDQWYN